MFFSYFHLICHEFISCCQVVAWLKVAWLQGCLLLCASIRGSVISTVSPQISKSGIFFSSFSVSRSSTVRPALVPPIAPKGPHFLLFHGICLSLLLVSDPNRPAVLVSLSILHFLPFLVFQYVKDI